jgi:glycosyltransferase involved in cell wall biosynthesis
MTTLVIQVPCFNEADTLPAVLADLPSQLPGVDRIVVLVVDDGSTDNTAEVARRAGAQLVRHKRRLGLARTFQSALRASLALGADLVVTTDGDHQYPGRFIAPLVAPLLAGEADLVIGDRRPDRLAHFSRPKQWLQGAGSWAISRLAKLDVPDAASGFRGLTREVARRLQVYTDFSHSLETLIQAGRQGMSVVSIPIEVNPPTRPSRLHRGSLHYTLRQIVSIARAFAIYEPVRTFGLLGLPFLLVGLGLEVRFAVLTLLGLGGVARYVQSVTIGASLAIVGFLLWVLGLLADGLLANRRLSEDLLVRTQQLADRLDAAGIGDSGGSDGIAPSVGLPAIPQADPPAGAGGQQVPGDGHQAEEDGQRRRGALAERR